MRPPWARGHPLLLPLTRVRQPGPAPSVGRWGSVVVSVLFWGFANQITTVDEAKQFYPLFGLGANVALIFSGRAVKIFSQVGANCGGGGGRARETVGGWRSCAAAVRLEGPWGARSAGRSARGTLGCPASPAVPHARWLVPADSGPPCSPRDAGRPSPLYRSAPTCPLALTAGASPCAA